MAKPTYKASYSNTLHIACPHCRRAVALGYNHGGISKPECPNCKWRIVIQDINKPMVLSYHAPLVYKERHDEVPLSYVDCPKCNTSVGYRENTHTRSRPKCEVCNRTIKSMLADRITCVKCRKSVSPYGSHTCAPTRLK